MSQTYTIERDSHNRLRAEVDEDLAVGIKILAETDPRRVERNVHGYAVLDIYTALGPIRIRDIRVMWSPTNERYFLRWRQWNTGKMRDGRKEYLDVAGPQDRDTRRAFESVILGVFAQVREEAAKGTLARDPETAGKLQGLKATLEAVGQQAEGAEGEVAPEAGSEAEAAVVHGDEVHAGA